MNMEKIAKTRKLAKDSREWGKPREVEDSDVIGFCLNGFIEAMPMISTAFAASLLPFGVIGLTFFAANRN